MTWQKKPTQYVRQNQEQIILSRKWGFKDPKANDALERTRHSLIRMLANPVIWKTFNVAQGNYFLSILEFESGWKEGAFRSFLDFFGISSEKSQDSEDKKIDGQAYYDKARVYLNMILGPAELSPIMGKVENQ